jgi:hypothetical protein
MAQLRVLTVDELARQLGVSREVVMKTREQIEAKWEADRQGALNFETKRIIRAEQRRQHEVEREERLQREAERQRAETVQNAAKAWRKLYGRQIADRLNAETTYHLIRVNRSQVAEDRRPTWIAFTDEAEMDRVQAVLASARVDVAPVERPNVHPGTRDRRPRQGVLGVKLGTVAKSLAAVDPSSAQVSAWVREHEEARRAEKAAAYERERDGRRERAEIATFGVSVSDGRPNVPADE